MDNRLRDLVEAAIEKTERGGLAWTAFDSESFRATIDPGHLHILRSFSADDATDATTSMYFVQVSDAQGRIVSDDEAGPDRVGDAKSFPLFDRLFQAARKAALGSDRVIDDMLHTLRGSRG
jgi:hypothetical protein